MIFNEKISLNLHFVKNGVYVWETSATMKFRNSFKNKIIHRCTETRHAANCVLTTKEKP